MEYMEYGTWNILNKFFFSKKPGVNLDKRKQMLISSMI